MDIDGLWNACEDAVAPRRAKFLLRWQQVDRIVMAAIIAFATLTEYGCGHTEVVEKTEMISPTGEFMVAHYTLEAPLGSLTDVVSVRLARDPFTSREKGSVLWGAKAHQVCINWASPDSLEIAVPSYAIVVGFEKEIKVGGRMVHVTVSRIQSASGNIEGPCVGKVLGTAVVTP